jgi:NAD(P)-dependent dehydrogenase (short-subunit alcohol dehydrogenase family)
VEHPLEIAEASVAEFERFWNVNVKGTLLCLKAESAAMKKQDIVTVPTRSGPRNIGRGTIINLGSCNSYMATPKIVQYTSAKHAVLGMTKNAGILSLLPSPFRIASTSVHCGAANVTLLNSFRQCTVWHTRQCYMSFLGRHSHGGKGGGRGPILGRIDEKNHSHGAHCTTARGLRHNHVS